ncbi:cilia- and flagella-associated protein 251-like, partial [Nannospalax galili]|uniref:cilia- and flagella-associated protein 251-like n=1 Tax=Nannospalax galili TaxID=1026970 RepID=UPI00111BD55E
MKVRVGQFHTLRQFTLPKWLPSYVPFLESKKGSEELCRDSILWKKNIRSAEERVLSSAWNSVNIRMPHYRKYLRLSLEGDVQTPNEQELMFARVPTAEDEGSEEEEEKGKEKKEDNTGKEDEEEETEEKDDNNEEEEKERIRGEENEKYEDGEVNEDGGENKEESEYEDQESDTSSIYFLSSNVSLSSFSPPSPLSSSSSSRFSLFQENLAENEGHATSLVSIVQSAQNSSTSPTLWGDIHEEMSFQEEEESSGTPESPIDIEALLRILLREKITELVFLFIYKYRMKESITE